MQGISWNAQYWSKRDGKRCYSCDKKTPTCEILDLFGIQSAKLCFRNKKTPYPFQSVIKSANLSWRFLSFKINRHRKHHVRFSGFSFPELNCWSIRFQTPKTLKKQWTRHPFQPLRFKSLPLAYPGGVPIPTLKKKDLISLLPLLRDDVSKAFYQALTADDGVASHETDESQEVEEDWEESAKSSRWKDIWFIYFLFSLIWRFFLLCFEIKRSSNEMSFFLYHIFVVIAFHVESKNRQLIFIIIKLIKSLRWPYN